jgi:Family of unknown function (DUF6345)
MATRLPVFPLQPADGGPDTLDRVAAGLFSLEGLEIANSEDGLVGRSGSVVVEFDRASGGVRAADESSLWNPALKPSLVAEDAAYEIAGKLLDQAGLLPRFEEGPFALTQVGLGGTYVASRNNGHRSRRKLDVQARYAVTVRNPGIDGAPELLPIVGGGGKFALTLGDEGRPIAFHGVWRPAGEPKFVEAIDAGEAEEQFKKVMQDVEVAEASSFLAYHASPFGTEQAVLSPVYVFSATIVVGGRKLPSRLVTIPATEFGPVVPEPQPQPGRIAALPPRRNGNSRAINPFEAGTSWIGSSGGLPRSQANAQGFVDGLAADGWLINFNWGDANAWESDWRRNDDTWVDAADFVFYSGHANMNGWTLSKPDDGSLSFTEVGGAPANPGDLWGEQDLEWVIIAACGPLQDSILAAGGGDVLARWDGAFDGLHTLMGYGAVTFDTDQEGSRVVKYAKQGTPLIDAWFRAAQEIQPATNDEEPPNGPNVWVGAMWVTKPGADPRFDHLWGHGSVSADPTSPTGLICMWTTC